MLVLALTSLGACGGGGESEDAKIGETVRSYLAAVADRDGKRACGFLTRKAQLRTFRRRRAHAGSDHPAEACASVVADFAGLYGPGRLRRVTVSRITVTGDRARARADDLPVRLAKVEGDWKIAISGLAQDVADTQPPARS